MGTTNFNLKTLDPNAKYSLVNDFNTLAQDVDNELLKIQTTANTANENASAAQGSVNQVANFQEILITPKPGTNWSTGNRYITPSGTLSAKVFKKQGLMLLTGYILLTASSTGGGEQQHYVSGNYDISGYNIPLISRNNLVVGTLAGFAADGSTPFLARFNNTSTQLTIEIPFDNPETGSSTGSDIVFPAAGGSKSIYINAWFTLA